LAVKLRVLGTALFFSVLIFQPAIPPGGAGLPGGVVVAGAATIADERRAESRPKHRDTVMVTDDEGASVAFPRPPRRIVSLLPAATEILFEIGAGGDLVGRTRFDSHPPEASEVPSVGDGVRPSVELVVSRQPDLVILFAGPDSRAASDALRRIGVPVLAVHHNTLADLHLNIERLGRVAGRDSAAAQLSRRIRDDLSRIRRITRELPERSVYYDAWWHPPITIGGGSYLDSLMTLAGGRNIFGDLASPSPQVSLEAIAARDPEIVLYPVHRGAERTPIADRPGWQVLGAAREDRIRVFDGEIVVRLGPRIADGVRELARAIHADAFSTPGSPSEGGEGP
jgi:ABC-type Fe3+-hydroxamate transport system substrate-binding protein